MRRKVMAVMAALICTISILCTATAGKADSIHEKELESYIIEEMSAADIPGMGISIVSAAYGAAQETDSDYVLGSLSKSFTAAAIMHLQEEEELSLEDTVSDYLPEYSAVSDVTISQLLHQTSGISSEERMSNLQGNGQKGVFEYANANYNLLGEIVEAVSGLSYEEYVSDNILDPLEMTSTYSMRTGADLSEKLLTGYQNFFGFPFPLKHQHDEEDDWIQVPSGYMISDAKDMGKYLQMYLNKGGRILTSESVDAMLNEGVDMSSDRSMEDEFFEGTAEYGLGQKLIEQLEEGIVSLEMGNTPEQIDSHAYLIQHGLLDGVMLLLVILSWMPVFLMGVWWKRRCQKPFSPLGLAADVIIHIVLPTALVVILPGIVPAFMVKRFVPDVYYVLCVVTASLYFGAVVKLLAGVVLVLKKKKGSLPEEEDKEEELEQEEIKQEVPVQEKVTQKESEKKPSEKKEPEEKKPKHERTGNGAPGQKRKGNKKKKK